MIRWFRTGRLRVMLYVIVGGLLLVSVAYLVSRRWMESRLFYAAARGDQREVARSLAKGAKGTYRGVARLTPLHAAVIAGDLGTVQVLIEGMIEVDLGAEFDMTPLHLAAALGLPEIVNALPGAGTSVSRLTDDPEIAFDGLEGMHHKLTPLRCAAGKPANFRMELRCYPRRVRSG